MENPMPALREKLPSLLVLFGIGGVLGAERAVVGNPLVGAACIAAGVGLYLARRQNMSPL